MCIECHRWKKKSPLCVSTNTVLAILCGRWVNFRPSGSASGLRVHHSVRCNYERLIPGRPVWHFMHDVSPGYLMHSFFRSAGTLSSLTFELLAACTRTCCQPQILSMFSRHSKQVVSRFPSWMDSCLRRCFKSLKRMSRRIQTIDQRLKQRLHALLMLTWCVCC